MHYVYILRSLDNDTLYFGYTSNLKSRFNEHRNGKSKYTKSTRNWEIVYYEAYKSEIDARTREKS